ncbi:MAG: hypothetical protein ACJAYK_000138 [Crocinitomicaceae bacterium]|jgi:hypothetical protein
MVANIIKFDKLTAVAKNEVKNVEKAKEASASLEIEIL